MRKSFPGTERAETALQSGLVRGWVFWAIPMLALMLMPFGEEPAVIVMAPGRVDANPGALLSAWM